MIINKFNPSEKVALAPKMITTIKDDDIVNNTNESNKNTLHTHFHNEDRNPLNILLTQKSKPTIASTNLQYTASTHDNKQTLELDHTPKEHDSYITQSKVKSSNFERDFPVEVMAPDSLNNTPVHTPTLDKHMKEPEARKKKQRLVRTYSETETNNFSSSTGSRVFDDMRHRPYHGYPSTRRVSFNRSKELTENNASDDHNNSFNNKSYIYATSNLLGGLEDEYIPNFNFGNNLLTKWFDDDEGFELFGSNGSSTSGDLDLKKRRLGIHTDLNPISVPEAPTSQHHHRRSRTGTGAGASMITPGTPPLVHDNQSGKLLSRIDLNSLQSLPDNFKVLPFSLRKKILLNMYPDCNYAELTNYIRTYVKSNSLSNSNLSKLSAKSSSSSILASYLSTLRTSSATASAEYDVNKKGAFVMGHILLDVVGRGAWGVIRESKNIETQALSAIKVISIENEKVKNLFFHELYIWSLLDHPRVLPLIGFKQTERYLFAVTKLNNGGTLYELTLNWGHVADNDSKEKLLRREESVLNIVKQVLQGLSYMHKTMGIVHGDLKLENVLINKEDQIMICDFGMSKIYVPVEERSKLLKERIAEVNKKYPEFILIETDSNHGEVKKSQTSGKIDNDKEGYDDGVISITSFRKKLGPSLTSTTLKKEETEKNEKVPDKNIGSLPYAAPELLDPEVNLCPLQDIWSLGVLMYTMLVGDLPFKHDYEPRLRMMILHGKFDSDVLYKHYGSNNKLVNLVMGCLRHNPNDRYDIDELMSRLN